MTDESADDGQEAASRVGTELGEDVTDEVFGVRLYAANALQLLESSWIPTGVAIFFKAYIEALAGRTGDGTADLLKRIRLRGKRATGETRIVVDDGASAIIVVTADLPSEARRALLDLDMTAPELRGKQLCWDRKRRKWRPSK